MNDIYSHPSLLAVAKMFFPAAVYQGPRALSFLRLTGERVLVVASKSAWARHGEKIAGQFEVPPKDFFWVEGEPDTLIAVAFAEQVKEKNYEYVVGVGGGSVMDVAKTGRLVSNAVKVILIPTTAGSGSEVSRYALLIKDEKKEPIISSELLPDVVLYDPVLLTSLTPEITAYTTADAYAHALEGLTSRLANPFSDRLALSALSLLTRWGPIAYREPENLDARTHLQIAGFLAGLVQSSASVGLVHGFADFFGPRFKLPHGRAIAAFLLPVMRVNLARDAGYYKKCSGEVMKETEAFFEALGLSDAGKYVFKNTTAEPGEILAFLKKDPAARTHPFVPIEEEVNLILKSVGVIPARLDSPA